MYTSPTYITQPIWNNAFSYNERIALWSEGKLYIPSLIQDTVAELQQGSEICFEEVLNGKLVSCTWLKNFLQTTFHDTPVYIVDNHNHALSFRHKHFNTSTFQRFNVLHIDQHSDIKPNSNVFLIPDLPAGRQGSWLPIPKVEDFVNEKTNVGNFITAATNSWIVKDIIQIRTDYALEHFNISTLQHFNFILDIDIDFRQDKEMTVSDIAIIQELMKKAELVTIATSPYFMDQEKAIILVQKLFT